MLTYDQIVEKICLCDVVMYLKAKAGVVTFPEKYRGMKVEEAVKNAKGVVLSTEKAGVQHVFVVKTSAYLKLAAAAPTLAHRLG